jgi:hypothetical protein
LRRLLLIPTGHGRVLRRVSILALLFAAIPAGIARAEDGIRVAQEAIALYQPEARERFGREVHLRIIDGDRREDPNAFAGWNGPGGAPRITIQRTQLARDPEDLVLHSVCHELGHFLGDRSVGVYEESDLTYEAEADYFSGSCLLRYFLEVAGMSESSARQAALETAAKGVSAHEGKRTRSDWARDRIYPFGIDDEYPFAECRLLTIENAIDGKPRPACWYRPKG